jgi:hypothetical protein
MTPATPKPSARFSGQGGAASDQGGLLPLLRSLTLRVRKGSAAALLNNKQSRVIGYYFGLASKELNGSRRACALAHHRCFRGLPNLERSLPDMTTANTWRG